MRATLMLANNQPVAGNRLMPVKAQPPPNLFGLGDPGQEPKTLQIIYSLLGTAAGAGLAYHGYKRTGGSWLAAIGWSAIGGFFWPLALPVAFAQGFGKPKEESKKTLRATAKAA